MKRELAVFRKPSDIIFKVEPTKADPVIRVSAAKRGNTFLHRGAVCMLTEVSAFQALNAQPVLFTQVARERIEELLKEAIFITNLQTGRTYAVKPDDEIEWIRVTMTVESVQ